MDRMPKAVKRGFDRCPLWVRSRHHALKSPCPLYPNSGHQLSALGCPLCARSGLMHRSKMSAIRSRFDHVIGAAENRWWNRYTNRLSGLEVDKKLEFRGLLNRKIGGFAPLRILSTNAPARRYKLGTFGP